MTIGSGPIGAGPIAAPLLSGDGFSLTLYDGITLSEGIWFGKRLTDTLTESMRVEAILAVAKGYLAVATDGLAIGDALSTNYGMVVVERLRLAETLIGNYIPNVSLVDAVRLVDALYSVRDVVLTDGIGIAAVEQVQRAATIVEELQLASQLIGAAKYNLTLIQAFRLADSLANFFGADMVEGIGIGDALSVRQKALGVLSDTVGIEAIISPQMLLHVSVAEGIGIDDTDVVQMLFSPTITEGVEITAGYLAPDGSLVTWVMNARNGAVTEYQNYDFTSFAQLGNRYIATSPEGLYELLGDDDDGTSIVARIKSGYMQFGGTRLSRLSAAYIATTGEGQMVLKIITKDGEQYVYQTDTRDGRNTKVHMGKGQRSRYFAFELVTAGQDFDIDTLEFVPVVVQRRV